MNLKGVPRSVLFLFGSVAVLIVVILGVLFFIKQHGVTLYPGSFVALWNAPQEVKDMVFVTEKNGVESVSRILWGGVQNFPFPGKHFLRIEKTRDGTLYALIEQASGAIDVYRVSKDTLQPLTEDGMFKTGFTVSPDGTYLAYAAPVGIISESDAYDVGRYEVHVLALPFGKEEVTFEGNHPLFSNDGGLIYFTNEGIVYKNLTRGDHAVTDDDLARMTVEQPYLGSNNVLIARNPVTSVLAVFGLVSTPQLYPQFIGVLPENTRTALSRGDVVYTIVVDNETVHVDRYANLLKEPVVVMRIGLTVINPLVGTF